MKRGERKVSEQLARYRLEAPAVEAGLSGLPPSPGSLECLWVRLKVGGRIRPRDAQLLRRLALTPFDRGVVYEMDAQGYVIAVGLPGELQKIDHAALLDEFERRFGVPESFTNVVAFHAR